MHFSLTYKGHMSDTPSLKIFESAIDLYFTASEVYLELSRASMMKVFHGNS